MPPTAAPVSSETDAIGRSAIRKASLRLIPLLGIGYGIAYMDRVNISFASLSMNRDLHFSATVYGFGAGLFFLSYAVCEIPSNLLLHRFGARRWLARIMVTWGLLAMAMFFVRTPIEFYTARFLLGVAEAGFFPGLLYYLTLWFPSAARARAISRFYIAFPLSSVLMGAIAGSLLGLDGHFGLAGWQWLFLVEGFPAVLLGLVFLVYLPDSPEQAAWLSPPERAWILDTLRSESAPTATSSHSVGTALADLRFWMLGLFLMLMLGSNYAYVFSLPDIIRLSTHLSTTNVGFVVSALFILGATAMLLGAAHSDRTGERYWHIILPTLAGAFGFIACGQSNQPQILIPAMTLIIVAFFSIQGPVLAIPQDFFSGRSAAAGLAAMNMVAILGGFLGPYAMGVAKDLTGNYQRGLSLMSIPVFLAAALMLYIRRRALASKAIRQS